jgi:hypothetical protein
MKKSHLLGSVCACLLSLVITPAVGSVIYTYTGNVFDSFSDPTSYNNTSAITGTVELAAPLDANRELTPGIIPISFSFTDGINTLTFDNTTSGSGINSRASFKFQTDGSGIINGWNLDLFSGWSTLAIGGTSTGIVTVGDTTFDFIAHDKADMRECLNGGCTLQDTDFGLIDDLNGSWSTAEVVPIPAAVWLFGTALFGLVAVKRRKA